MGQPVFWSGWGIDTLRFSTIVGGWFEGPPQNEADASSIPQATACASLSPRDALSAAIAAHHAGM